MNYIVYYKDLDNKVTGGHKEFICEDPWIGRQDAISFVRELTESETLAEKNLEILVLYFYNDKPKQEYLIGSFNFTKGNLKQNHEHMQLELRNLDEESKHLEQNSKNARGFRIFGKYGFYPLGLG